ncbi:MAG: hypothetical protein OQL20_05180 [Sedimenticola sp.]|nr:hypothetical protein [Sedimenticola sp.]
MFVVDDPVLALIVRFVIGARELRVSDEPFLQRQVEQLQQHVASYPDEEQEEQAVAWIARHAEHYRAQWQNRVVNKQAQQVRCVDCPMSMRGTDQHCVVHFKWLDLLKRYTANEMNASEYVKASLGILQANKEALIERRSQEIEEFRQLKAYHDARNKPL